MHIEKSSNTASDLDLVSLYQTKGDLEVLGELYQRYMHLVYGVSLGYFKNSDDAQDAVMQIFELLIDKVQKHEIHNFKSWLHVLTKNYCLMELRKRKSGNTITEEIPVAVMENEVQLHHDNETDLEENIVKLEECIKKLKNEQKRCVELFYLEKKCYQEIVELTNFDLKKVKSYIQNGKRNLKICIENSEG